MKVLIADVESDGFLDAMTRIWCIVIKDRTTGVRTSYADQPGYRPLSEAYAELRSADLIVFHNGLTFDTHAINKVAPGTVDWRKVFDTMSAARLYEPTRNGGHALEAYGEFFGFPKGEWTDFSKFDPGMVTYCERDVDLTEKLYDWLLKKVGSWIDALRVEFDAAYCIGLQMHNGFYFDVTGGQKLLAELTAQMVEKEQELIQLFPPIYYPKGEFTPKKDDAKKGYVAGCTFTRVELVPFKATSRQHIADRLIRKYGWKPTEFTDGGSPKVDDTIIKGLPYPEAPILAEYLRLSKMVGILNAPMKKNGSGGGWLVHLKGNRIHGYVNSNGAATGRMTHSKPNTANIDGDERMRALWIPRPGWVLLGADAEGLELRMLGHYLEVIGGDGGAYSRAVVEGNKADETDNHSLTRKAIGLYSRDNAKRFIYAMIYGAGDAKLGLIIIEDATEAGKLNQQDSPHLYVQKNGKLKLRSRTELGREGREKLMKNLTGFDSLMKRIKYLYRSRKQKFRKAWINGLDGRRIWLTSEHSALNYLLQGGGAIVMKKALAIHFARNEATYGTDWAYCANVHDEVQIECRTREVAERLGKDFCQAITDAGIALGVRCPLTGTMDIGANWSETH